VDPRSENRLGGSEDRRHSGVPMSGCQKVKGPFAQLAGSAFAIETSGKTTFRVELVAGRCANTSRPIHP